MKQNDQRFDGTSITQFAKSASCDNGLLGISAVQDLEQRLHIIRLRDRHRVHFHADRAQSLYRYLQADPHLNIGLAGKCRLQCRDSLHRFQRT